VTAQSTSIALDAEDLERLLDEQDVEPDERYCHRQAVIHDAGGERVWQADRPVCGSPRATRCPGPRLTARYAGEANCAACGRPICPACAAHDRGAR